MLINMQYDVKKTENEYDLKPGFTIKRSKNSPIQEIMYQGQLLYAFGLGKSREEVRGIVEMAYNMLTIGKKDIGYVREIVKNF
jgi:hypothetical protein